MKRIIILITGLFFLYISCARFKIKKLSPHIEFSIPIGEKINNVKVIQSSDYFFEIPSEYFVKEKFLYLVDIFNFRVLKLNRKNQLILNFGERYNEKEINEFNLFSTNFNGIPISQNLFNFLEPGQIYVDNKNNILVENILVSITEEHKYNAFSIILKFDKNGNPINVYGKRITPEGNIYPFEEMDHFSVDLNDNLFVFEKKDNNIWKVYKFSKPDRLLALFDSAMFIKKLKIDKEEKAVIENIDHSFTGNFLIVGVTIYKNDYQFVRSEFYKVYFTGAIEKLFTLKSEEYNFILVNNSDIIYLWKTEEKTREEKILLRLLNLKGKIIANKVLELKRTKARWFNIKVQKNDIIAGINLSNKLFNIVLWE